MSIPLTAQQKTLLLDAYWSAGAFITSESRSLRVLMNLEKKGLLGHWQTDTAANGRLIESFYITSQGVEAAKPLTGMRL